MLVHTVPIIRESMKLNKHNLAFCIMAFLALSDPGFRLFFFWKNPILKASQMGARNGRRSALRKTQAKRVPRDLIPILFCASRALLFRMILRRGPCTTVFYLGKDRRSLFDRC